MKETPSVPGREPETVQRMFTEIAPRYDLANRILSMGLDLHWRQVGPYRGGWATAVEGHPDRVTTFYFGSADGGVWKTDNAGVSWQPLFEQHGSASIGALSLAPSNPDVIWIGTGQPDHRPHSSSTCHQSFCE